MAKYIIKPFCSDPSESRQISQKEYIEIINARKLVSDVLLFRNVFSYVLENYYELESAIPKSQEELEKSIQDLDIAHLYNRRIMNFLSTNFHEKLQTLPKEIDIVPLTQKYISLLGKIYEDFKSEVSFPFDEAKTFLIDKIEYYCKEPEEGFEIMIRDEKN